MKLKKNPVDCRLIRFIVFYINVRESRRGNQEKLATLGTQDTGRRQTKHKTQYRKLKRRVLEPVDVLFSFN
jgi:hypothetical protein